MEHSARSESFAKHKRSTRRNDKCNGPLRPCHHAESNELTMKAFALADLVGDAALCNREKCATA
jgi:hypothetical protein